MIKDERDERAWVMFASGFRERHHGYSYADSCSNESPLRAAHFADQMLVELQKRRTDRQEGPYR